MASVPAPVAQHPAGVGDLVTLDRDHPGFRDPAYRMRRNDIARVALDYVLGDPVPRITYTAQEHGVWAAVWRRLGPLHRRYACRVYNEVAHSCSSTPRRFRNLPTSTRAWRPGRDFG